MIKVIKNLNVYKYQIELSKVFAKYVIETNYNEYSRRKQSNLDKLYKDIYNGKIAEFYIYNYLFSKVWLSQPDLMIYDKNKKSFDADLTFEKYNIHVKSCMSDSGFPNSWLFQPNDKLIKTDNNDVMFLVVMNKNNNYAYQLRNNYVLVNNLYKEPVKKSLDKKVIYEDDIKKGVI